MKVLDIFLREIDINQNTSGTNAVYIANALNTKTSMTSAINHCDIAQKQPLPTLGLYVKPGMDSQAWKISLLSIIKDKISLRVNYLKKLKGYVVSLINEKGGIIQEQKENVESLLIDFFNIPPSKNILQQLLYLRQLIEGADIKCIHYLDLLKIFTTNDLNTAISSLQILLEIYSNQATKNNHNPKADLTHIYTLLSDENYIKELSNILEPIIPKHHHTIEDIVTAHPLTSVITCDDSVFIQKADILWEELLKRNRLTTEWRTYLNTNYKENIGKIRWLALMLENGDKGMDAFKELVKKDIEESQLLNKMELISQNDSIMAGIIQNVRRTYKILNALDAVGKWLGDEKMQTDKSKLSTSIGKTISLKNSEPKISDELKEIILVELNNEDIQVLRAFFHASKTISYNKFAQLLLHMGAKIHHIDGSHYIIELDLFSCSINTSYMLDQQAGTSTKEKVKDTINICSFNKKVLREFFEKIGVNLALLKEIFAERENILGSTLTK